MSIRDQAVRVLPLLLAAAGLAACGGSPDPAGSGDYVDGKTFTLATLADPGNLDPQASFVATEIGSFAYDTLVGVDPRGTIQPQLASSWKVTAEAVTFELRDDVTCSDGSAFDAQTVVDNIEYVADVANASPFHGVYVPADARASASGSTVAVTLTSPAPFVLEGFAHLPMVCRSGMKDRDSLKAGTAGTGPFTVTESVPGDHYTLAVRKDYAWGPGGATTSETGTPSTVVFKVVSSESTATNLILSGQANAASFLGRDGDRLEKQGIDAVETQSAYAHQWYNQAPGRVGSDPVVRTALTQALDLTELQRVITSGRGSTPTALAVYDTGVCDGNTVKGNLPGSDPAAAADALTAAGWAKNDDGVLTKDGMKLSLTFVYSSQGPGQTAAAELVVAAWEKLGAEVDARALDITEHTAALFQTGDWDVTWSSPKAPNPLVLMPFVSGPSPALGGNNFGSVGNADYDSHAEAALTEVGTDSCPEWEAAEAALFQSADVVPFANVTVLTFHKGAELERAGNLMVPTSIRMLS
ncbi:ABC transporter substrate-binding protein [Nocardioides sp. LHD-245]|uniref:ABC transporter substrate-binding protein n=1 Tax=Nocardioides sp. LHD-245 TaxID=3051387 RepID=UPI0027E1CDA3|nr:ABC transporter substrate-binding protein [Nocardioides sp. LHD-245]